MSPAAAAVERAADGDADVADDNAVAAVEPVEDDVWDFDGAMLYISVLASLGALFVFFVVVVFFFLAAMILGSWLRLYAMDGDGASS